VRIVLENFSGKSALSVYQNFHSKVLMKNVVSIFSLPVKDMLTADTLADRRYNYQVNFTQVLATAKDLISMFILKIQKENQADHRNII
jgi:hypothetical protein